MKYFKTRQLPISLLFDTQSHKACGTIDCCLSNLVLLILRISHRTAHNTFWRTIPNFLLQLSSKSSAQQISALNHIDFHQFLIISFRLGKRKNLAGTSLLSRSGSKFLRLIVKFLSKLDYCSHQCKALQVHEHCCHCSCVIFITINHKILFKQHRYNQTWCLSNIVTSTCKTFKWHRCWHTL